MASIAPYSLHKVWDTPAIHKSVQPVLSSQAYLISGFNYFIKLATPKVMKDGTYAIAVQCQNPPENGHVVSIKCKLISKKQKQFEEEQYNFTPKNTIQFVAIGITEDEIKRFSTKDKVSIDVVIKYEGEGRRQSVDYRALTGCIGLQNQALTCYMNALLQTLFHISAFRRLIYAVPAGASPIPQSLQKLFTLMQLSPVAPSTIELTKSFGWTQSDAFQQHDIEEFMAVLLDKLGERLKQTALSGRVEALFEGETVTTIRTLNIEYQSSRVENFSDVGLVVSNLNNLYESLAEYTSDVTLDGDSQYEIEDGVKDDAVRSTRFRKLPPVLHCHLGRFAYSATSFTGMEKVTSKFEFPRVLDMGPYMEIPTTCIYDLNAVMVHIGNGALGGHYVAFCKIGDKWIKFNDEIVEIVSPEQAIDAHFGGPGTSAHAYLLSYVRRDSSETILKPVDSNEIPQRLKDYYESQRASLDPNVIRIKVLNKDLTVEAKRSQGISSIVSEIRKKSVALNELWLVQNTNDGEKIERRLKGSEKISDVFGGSGIVFAADFDTGNWNMPTIVHIHYLNLKPSRLIDVGYLGCSQNHSIADLMPIVAKKCGFPESCLLKIYYDDDREIKEAPPSEFVGVLGTQELYVQSMDPGEKVKDNNNIEDPNTVIIRDMLPEVDLNTVPRFLAHIRQCSSITVKIDDKNLTVEIPLTMTLKVLVKCLRAHLGLRDDQAVALSLERGGPLLGVANDLTLSQIFGVNSPVLHCEVREKPQPFVDSLVCLRIPVFDESVEEKAVVKIEAAPDETVGDISRRIEAEANVPRVRIVSLVGCTIQRIVGEGVLASAVQGLALRADVRAEEDEGAKLLRCAFSYNQQMPEVSTFLTPFVLAVSPDEPVELVSARIGSIVPPELAEFSLVLSTSGLRFQLLPEDILYDQVGDDSVLYLVVSRAALIKLMSRQQNEGVKIDG